MNLNRRAMFGAIPAIGMAAASSSVAAAPAMSARERMDYHLAEFKKAVQEVDPTISSWRDADFDLCRGMGCGVVVSGHRKL